MPVHRIGGSDLCALLRVSPATLTGMVKRGHAVKISHDSYDLVETIGRYAEHLRGVASGRGNEEAALTLTGERARLARAQAEGVELKNAALRGELVPAAEVRTEWVTAATDLRAALLAVPARVAARLALDREAAAALETEIRLALEVIADAE